jgi:hypothetical protein
VKRVLVVVVGIALAAGLVVGLAELTQNRPDIVDVDSASRIRYRVETRGYDEELAAIGLWAACQQVVDSRVPDRMPSAEGDDATFTVTVRPALGEHAQRRLIGCIEDGTIDRVRGDVVSITEFVRGQPAAGEGHRRNG